MHLSQWNRQRAFTLIELVIVLVIAGALMAIAVPSYRDYLERTRRTAAFKTSRDFLRSSATARRWYLPGSLAT